MKVVKVGHAVGTLNIHGSGGGDTKEVLDAKVNQKLQEEGWDDVTFQVIHVNKAGEEPTSLIVLYRYVKYAEDVAEVKRK